MAVIHFSKDGMMGPVWTYTLTHIDKSKLLQFMDQKKRPTGLRGWCGVGDKFEFEFNTDANLNKFRNQLIKLVA